MSNLDSSTIEIGFAFVALERFKNKTFTKKLIDEIQNILDCNDFSSDAAFQKKNSFLARLVLKSENNSCEIGRIKEKMMEIMKDDKNSLNLFLRDQLQYKAPYLGKSFRCCLQSRLRFNPCG